MASLLVPIDFSDVSRRVVDEAVRLARALDLPIRLIHVAAPDPEFVGYEAGPKEVREQRARELRDEHRYLQKLAEVIEQQGIAVEPRLIQGPTVATILEQAEQADAAYIVLGSHGHSALYKVLVGGVTEGIVRGAPCPVVIVSARRAQHES